MPSPGFWPVFLLLFSAFLFISKAPTESWGKSGFFLHFLSLFTVLADCGWAQSRICQRRSWRGGSIMASVWCGLRLSFIILSASSAKSSALAPFSSTILSVWLSFLLFQLRSSSAVFGGLSTLSITVRLG